VTVHNQCSTPKKKWLLAQIHEDVADAAYLEVEQQVHDDV
jgi:hypothetical protein